MRKVELRTDADNGRRTTETCATVTIPLILATNPAVASPSSFAAIPPRRHHARRHAADRAPSSRVHNHSSGHPAGAVFFLFPNRFSNDRRSRLPAQFVYPDKNSRRRHAALGCGTARAAPPRRCRSQGFGRDGDARADRRSHRGDAPPVAALRHRGAIAAFSFGGFDGQLRWWRRRILPRHAGRERPVGSRSRRPGWPTSMSGCPQPTAWRWCSTAATRRPARR
jgi:hypothetical protein